MAIKPLIRSASTKSIVTTGKSGGSKVKRRVTFDLDCNKTYANTQWSQEECRRLWITPKDYEQMRANRFAAAKQAHKSDKRVEDTKVSYKAVLLRVYDACCSVSKETNGRVIFSTDEALLTRFVGRAHSRAGLEKLYIRELAYEKKQRREFLTQTVLTLQANLRNNNNNDDDDRNAQRTANILRNCSQSISRPTRLFARHMAQALASSVVDSTTEMLLNGSDHSLDKN